jgi:hypothetical protein
MAARTMDQVAEYGPAPQVREQSARTLPGLPMLGLAALLSGIGLSVAGKAALCPLDQQADVVRTARQRIVASTVGMVKLALARLAEHDVVEVDNERKAAKVSNLLVVLCSDRETQLVAAAGSRFQ